MHGQGDYSWPDGSSYSGEWIEGLRSGEGVFTAADGERYDGAWLEGERHGQGMERHSNGRSREGEWVRGRLVRWLGPEVFGDAREVAGRSKKATSKKRADRFKLPPSHTSTTKAPPTASSTVQLAGHPLDGGGSTASSKSTKTVSSARAAAATG